MGQSRIMPKAELLQTNLEMQKSLIAAELGVLNDVLSMASQLERALSTTAETCQPIINACFGAVSLLRLLIETVRTGVLLPGVMVLLSVQDP